MLVSVKLEKKHFIKEHEHEYRRLASLEYV